MEWFYRNGYDPIQIVIEGLKIAGTDDRAALRDALEKVRYQGFLSDFKYFPTDHEGTLGEAFVPVVVECSIWKDGDELERRSAKVSAKVDIPHQISSIW